MRDGGVVAASEQPHHHDRRHAHAAVASVLADARDDELGKLVELCFAHAAGNL